MYLSVSLPFCHKTLLLKSIIFYDKGAFENFDTVSMVVCNLTDLVELIVTSTLRSSEVQQYVMHNFEKLKMLLQPHSLIKPFFKKFQLFFGEGASGSLDFRLLDRPS